MNQVCLMGRIAQEPELRTTSTGKSVLSFCLAVKNYSRDQNNNVDWIDCVAWDKNAEFIHTYFSKGNLIAVTGRLSTRNWEDKNGNKRKSTEVIIDRADFTGEKKEADSGAYSPEYTPRGSGMPVEVKGPTQSEYDSMFPVNMEVPF